MIIKTDSRFHVSVIDSRNGYVCTGGSKRERLLVLLIIKLEPLTSVHTSRSAVLCHERWPGLPNRSTGRLVWLQIVCWTGRRVLPPSPPPSSDGIIEERTMPWCACRFTPVVNYTPLSPSSPTLSAVEWVFLWQICFTGGGEGDWPVLPPAGVPVWAGHTTRWHSFISWDSKRRVASHVRRRSVQSAYLSSLYVGLPLHHPPWRLHQTSQQRSTLEQPNVAVMSEMIIEK